MTEPEAGKWQWRVVIPSNTIFGIQQSSYIFPTEAAARAFAEALQPTLIWAVGHTVTAQKRWVSEWTNA